MTPDLSAWGLPAPAVVRRATQGTNNHVWLLDNTYVLREYQNLSVERIEAEHRLLETIGSKGLPFGVPTPVRSCDGRSVVDSRALFRYLPGRSGDRDNLADVRLAGEALGRLDIALAEVPHDLSPHDWRIPLSAVHPAVPDIDELCDELESLLPKDEVEWLRAEAGPSERAYLALATTLPLQIVHGDLAMSNLLMDQGRVSAVLDFEVAGLDIRVNDVVAALSMLDERMRAPFLRAYRSVVDLTEAERQAIPILLRHRGVGSVVWRAGRWRRGQSTLDEVRSRLVDPEW